MNLKWILITILFVSFGVMFAQAPKNFYGTQLHLGQVPRPLSDTTYIKQVLDSVKSMGVNIVRDECLWSELEKSPGVYNFWPTVDFFVKAAYERGIQVLMILDYNNSLYAPNAGSGPVTDSNRAAYSRYCREMVKHFSPMGVKLYEIWNEPNFQMFWGPAPNAADYALLLKTAYPVIKQTDSTVTVIGCATSPLEGDPPPAIMWRTFIQGVWNNGGGPFMDAVSFHQYRVDKTPENYLITDIQNLQAIIGSTKPIYITEIGYHTATVWPNTSVTKQALYVAKLYIVGRGAEQLKSISYYDFKNDGTDPANPEHNFGLIYDNFTPKPAFFAYKNVVKFLGDKNYQNFTKNGDSYKYTFQGQGQTVNVLFNSTATTLNKNELFTSVNLKLVSLYGSTYYVIDKDKMVNVNYTEEPLFVFNLPDPPEINKLEMLPKVDTVMVGQKISFSINGITSAGEPVYIDSTNIQWSVSSPTGKIDSTGLFTALQTGTVTVTGSFAGKQVQKQIVILPSYTFMELENFNSTNNFSVSYFQTLPSTTVSIVDTNYSSYPRAMLINYAFKYEGIDRHRVIFDCDYPLYGEPDTLYIDFLNNGNGHVAEFQLADADNEIFKVNTSQIPAKTGWLTAKAKLTGFGSRFTLPARLKKITVYLVKSGAIKDSTYSGSILIDKLTVHNALISGKKEESQSINRKDYQLFQNYPNPFNPETTISYYLGHAGDVDLTVFDLLGNKVIQLVNQRQEPGNYKINFNGETLAGGVYFYRLKGELFTETRKLILLR